jgi:hypothetical protein
MIHANVFDRTGGGLPHFTDLGGYPLVYLCGDGDTVCPTCINIFKEFITLDDPQWNVIDVYVNWEDSEVYCCSCNEKIPAAYTD